MTQLTGEESHATRAFRSNASPRSDCQSAWPWPAVFSRARRCFVPPTIPSHPKVPDPAKEANSADPGGADLSVEALVAALVVNYATINSIYCEYTQQFLATAHRKESEPKQLRYARSGKKWRLVELDEAAGTVIEVTRCYDGDFVYSFAVAHKDGQDQTTVVQIQARAEPGGFNPEQLIGRDLSNVSRSLPQVLMRDGLSRSDAKLPDGTVMPRLSVVGVVAQRTNPPSYDVAVIVDPGHDFLPREILITETAGNISAPAWAQHWTIAEYQQVFDQQSRRDRWFPAAGVLTQGTTGGRR